MMDEAQLEILRMQLAAISDLPFEVIISPVMHQPEIDPRWEEPEDFDWENDTPPYTGRMIPFIVVAWKVTRNGSRYGNYILTDGGPPELIIQTLGENYSATMKELEKG